MYSNSIWNDKELQDEESLREKLLTLRGILFFGIILYPGFGFIYHWLNPDFYDPYSLRFIFSGILGIIFSASFFKRNLALLWDISYYLRFLVVFHILYLTYQNGLAMEYFLGFEVTFMALTLSIRRFLRLSVFVLTSFILVCILIFTSSIPASLQAFYMILNLFSSALGLFSIRQLLENRRIISSQKDLMSGIFNESHDALFLCDPETHEIHEYNQQALKIFRIEDKRKLIGIPFERLQKEKFDKSGKTSTGEKFLSSDGWSQKAIFECSDGKSFWGELDAKIIQIDSKEHLLVRISDIDEKIRAQKRLEESENLYRLLAENANDLISKHTQEGFFTYASPACKTILGYDPEEVYNTDILSKTHPGDEESLKAFRKNFNLYEQPSTFDFRVKRKDGEYIWMETNLKALKDEYGEINEIMAISREITERKEAEQKLLERESTMSAMAEASNNLLLADDYDQGINQALEKLGKSFNVDRAYIYEVFMEDNEEYTKPVYEWYSTNVSSKKDRSFLKQMPISHFPYLAEKIKNGEPIYGTRNDFNLEIRQMMEMLEIEALIFVPVFHKNKFIGFLGFDDCKNSRKWTEVEIRAMETMAGTIGGAIWNRDAEREIKKAKNEAEEAARAKADFLATMSHEIRTPMNSVIGMANLLLETSLNQEQKEYLGTIKLSGNNLLDLINDILDFSKIESGNLDLEHQTFEIHGCIEDAIDLLSNNAARKNIDLAYFIEPNIPDLVKGDASRLRQILVNLINNAVKFTEEGEIVVDVKLNKQEVDYTEFLFNVKDTGVGITEAKQKQLFQAFKQGDSSTTRQYGGTGLGLAISRKLVNLMEGDIWLSSKPNEGSTFSFTLRLKSSSELPKVYMQNNMEEFTGKKVGLMLWDSSSSKMIIDQLEQWGVKTKMLENDQYINCEANLDTLLLDITGSDKDIEKINCIYNQKSKDTKLILRGYPYQLEHLKNETKAKADEVINNPVRRAGLYNALINTFEGTGQINNEGGQQGLINAQLGDRFPLNVLLAEDNVINQKLGVRVLEKMNFKPDIAGTGLEVLEGLKNKDYDLVFMDIQMPEMDGIEATKQIRAKSDDPREPVIIAMTAAALNEDRNRCLEAGMNDYISKPVNFQKLNEIVEKWGKFVTDNKA